MSGAVIVLPGIAALVGRILWGGERGSAEPGCAPGRAFADPLGHQARPARAPEAELFDPRLREAVAPNFDIWAGTPVADLVLRGYTGTARRPMLEEALAGLRTDSAIVRTAGVIAVVEPEAPRRQARRDAFQDAVLRQCGHRVLRS